MKTVIVAKYAGVCFGVKRALDLLENAVLEGQRRNIKVNMLGPLIHNPRVIEEYSVKGVEVIGCCEVRDHSIVVVRSHGITSDEEKFLVRRDGVEIVDTTCPFVKKIHRLVAEKSSEGFGIVILGDSEHSEVKGIISRICGPYIVVSPFFTDDDTETLSHFMEDNEKVFAVAQTTSQPANFKMLVEKIRSMESSSEFDFRDTVCDATYQRQQAARDLASKVDSMVVIGGRNSSNTSKLFSVVTAVNENSFWIESVDDITAEIKDSMVESGTIGITAGASTPDSQIEELKNYLEGL